MWFGHALFTSKRLKNSCLTKDSTRNLALIHCKSTVNEMVATCAQPPSTPHTSRFYLLPKIHKPNNPGQLIVSACNCPTENISAYLDEVLAPFVKSLPTYVKDTNHALHIFDSFRFDTATPGHHFLFTMDVKALYTVIPNDCGLQVLAYFLDKRDIKEPTTSTLTRLAEWCSP